MVFELRAESGSARGTLARVGERLGINPETLRNWVEKAEVDSGQRPGTTSDDRKRIADLEKEVRELRRANVPEGGECLFRPGTRPPISALAEFVDSHRDRFGVEPACAVLEIAPSTYYAAKRREENPPARDTRDEKLMKEIMRVWQERGRGVYGARKVWRELSREGTDVARCTAGRLMRELGIAGATARRKRPRTAVPAGPGHERPSDLLERDFTAPAPNRRWVADITYVETAGGFVYSSLILDLFSRKIVGWQVSDTLRAELALDALEMAIWSRGDRIGGKLAIIPTAECNIRRSGMPSGSAI